LKLFLKIIYFNIFKVKKIENISLFKSGELLVDGINIKEYDTTWYHRRIGYVSQEPTLFSNTLRENIVYGVETFTEEDIKRAMKMANASEFIYDKQLFPDGLDTRVGERGVKLSGG
jgi:ABC-type multidrug transport system fused ATPase/permease subunit